MKGASSSSCGLEALGQDLSLVVVHRGQGTEGVIINVQDRYLALHYEGLVGLCAHLAAREISKKSPSESSS